MFDNLHLADLTKLRASLNGNPMDPAYIGTVGRIVSQWLDEEIRKRTARKRPVAAKPDSAHGDWTAAFPSGGKPAAALGKAPSQSWTSAFHRPDAPPAPAHPAAPDDMTEVGRIYTPPQQHNPFAPQKPGDI